MLDMNRLPFVRARWFTPVDPATPRTILWLVTHDMEAPEGPNTAENIANYFVDPRRAQTKTEKDLGQKGKPVKASAHTCWDNNSAIRCVLDKDVAYAAPGANSNGIQYELAGYGRQSREQWLDEYGKQMLALVCEGMAQDCVKYGIPPKHLTDDEIRAKKKGIIGHYQASRIFKLSDHTDPGAGFPWDVLTLNVALLVNQKRGLVTIPKAGDRRWSGYFYKTQGQGWVVLVSFNNDKDWTFRVEGKTPILKAQTPWSQMPLKP